MKLEDLLKATFDGGYSYKIENCVVFGEGKIKDKSLHILGVAENTSLGVQESLTMSEKVIDIIKSGDKKPIFMPVDVIGQKLSMQDEWLGMNQYFGHLLESLEIARRSGHTLISMVYSQAIGGGFIAFGLMCDKIYALPEAKVAVMWLEGMAKVTKIPLQTLEELSKTSPVFAPGIENFKKLGGIYDVLTPQQISNQIASDLENSSFSDERMQLGFSRGGRVLALPVMEKILSA